MIHYHIYGLDLYSNSIIPYLLVASKEAKNMPSISVHFGFVPEQIYQPLQILPKDQEWYISDRQDKTGEPILRVWLINASKYFRFRYADETEFFVSLDTTQIWAIWPDNLSFENTVVYLLGPVIGFILRLRGLVCLHASAIDIGGKAVIFLGDSGAGKSTTAAIFSKLGYSILSDDVVPLLEKKERYLVQPAYPQLRLWSDSVEALYGSAKALPRLVPTHPDWDKQFLNLSHKKHQFQTEPLPLAKIYLLSERRSDLTVPLVETLSSYQLKFFHVLLNSYDNYLLNNDMRAQEFKVLSRIATQVPILKLVLPDNLAKLERICTNILTESLSV